MIRLAIHPCSGSASRAGQPAVFPLPASPSTANGNQPDVPATSTSAATDDSGATTGDGEGPEAGSGSRAKTGNGQGAANQGSATSRTETSGTGKGRPDGYLFYENLIVEERMTSSASSNPSPAVCNRPFSPYRPQQHPFGTKEQQERACAVETESDLARPHQLLELRFSSIPL